MAEATLLSDDKLERIVVAVQRQPDQLLRVARCGPLVPQTALPALVDARLRPYGLPNALFAAVYQAEGRVVLVDHDGGEQAICTVRLPVGGENLGYGKLAGLRGAAQTC